MLSTIFQLYLLFSVYMMFVCQGELPSGVRTSGHDATEEPDPSSFKFGLVELLEHETKVAACKRIQKGKEDLFQSCAFPKHELKEEGFIIIKANPQSSMTLKLHLGYTHLSENGQFAFCHRKNTTLTLQTPCNMLRERTEKLRWTALNLHNLLSNPDNVTGVAIQKRLLSKMTKTDVELSLYSVFLESEKIYSEVNSPSALPENLSFVDLKSAINALNLSFIVNEVNNLKLSEFENQANETETLKAIDNFLAIAQGVWFFANSTMLEINEFESNRAVDMCAEGIPFECKPHNQSRRR